MIPVETDTSISSLFRWHPRVRGNLYVDSNSQLCHDDRTENTEK
uniref:Uncharacterized protein n=1 Tax=Arundo donax TaxID=35708 RepID=A0A0A9BLW7_ARUDO